MFFSCWRSIHRKKIINQYDPLDNVNIFTSKVKADSSLHAAISTVGTEWFESPSEISVVIKKALWYLKNIFSWFHLAQKKMLVFLLMQCTQLKKKRIKLITYKIIWKDLLLHSVLTITDYMISTGCPSTEKLQCKAVWYSLLFK